MSCTSLRIDLSALLDLELDARQSLEAARHLASCASCRAAFQAMDGLGGLLPAPAAAPRRTGRPPAWLVAATLALAGGLGAWFATRPGEPSRYVEVGLETAPSAMSEARFVELTAELLRSESRYRHAMLEILDHVDRDLREGERERLLDLPERPASGRGQV